MWWKPGAINKICPVYSSADKWCNIIFSLFSLSSNANAHVCFQYPIPSIQNASYNGPPAWDPNTRWVVVWRLVLLPAERLVFILDALLFAVSLFLCVWAEGDGRDSEHPYSAIPQAQFVLHSAVQCPHLVLATGSHAGLFASDQFCGFRLFKSLHENK